MQARTASSSLSSVPYTHYESMSSDDSASLATPYHDEHDMNPPDMRHPSAQYPIKHHDDIHSVLEHAMSGINNYRYGLGDFVFHRTLGTGSFGRVHLVRSKNNFRFYAVKVLAKEKVVRMKQVEHTLNERNLLTNVQHPFIVNLWGTFQDPTNLYMVMDFVAGGELFSLLRKSTRFPDPVAKFYAAEVALALHYLHSQDIIYRDLKPENILLGADGHIKMTDFGFSKVVPHVTSTLCGTPDYLAPEIVEGKLYNKSVDWYALGILIFEMLAGFPPFFTTDPQPNPFKLYELIVAGNVVYPTYFDARAHDLIKRFITADATERYGNLKYGAKDIFAHAWFGEVPWEKLYKKEIPAPYVPKIDGDGDASQFARYNENNTLDYGRPAEDAFGYLFRDFDYST
ncbi:kinase-like protein [Auriculariales sp. MPI-PUGE-AT-0066]|nr:kinase-like protein [Auriculariales sp. MPI-PUGE-AT-0066]